jgi:hypothetical protein
MLLIRAGRAPPRMRTWRLPLPRNARPVRSSSLAPVQQSLGPTGRGSFLVIVRDQMVGALLLIEGVRWPGLFYPSSG